MDKYLNRAKELESQLKTDRRYIHQNAEAGMCLPNTTAYVKNRLMEIGLEPEEICPSGLSVLIKGDKPEIGRADRKSTRLNSSHSDTSRMPSSA